MLEVGLLTVMTLVTVQEIKGRKRFWSLSHYFIYSLMKQNKKQLLSILERLKI